MSTLINPDPHAGGYKFNPKHCVTAIFTSYDDLKAALRALRQSGFAHEEIDLFVGEEGAEKYDLTGEHHGKIVHLLRDAQLATADEQYLFQELDQAIRKGDIVISIATGGEDQKKQAAVEVLKAQHAHEIYYWGMWSIEHF